MIANLMTPYAPLSEEEVSWMERAKEELSAYLERAESMKARYVRVGEAAWRAALDVIAYGAGRERPLRRGVHRTWTTGEIQKGLLMWTGIPPPSKPTIRKALGWLCVRGIIQRECHGTRPVYRFVRRWEDQDTEALFESFPDPHFDWIRSLEAFAAHVYGLRIESRAMDESPEPPSASGPAEGPR